MNLSQYAKAIVAGLVPGVLMYFTLRSGGVTSEEWQDIIAIVLASSGLTWAVPNTNAALYTRPILVPAPDSVTTVNVDRGLPSVTAGDTWTNPAPTAGAHERLMEDHT